MTTEFIISSLFERVERSRRRKRKFKDTHITLAHGSGGRAMDELVEGVFVEYVCNPLLELLEDQAVFEVGRANGHRYDVDACIIGEVRAEPRSIVGMRTGFGGTRIVDMLAGEQLPRIC